LNAVRFIFSFADPLPTPRRAVGTLTTKLWTCARMERFGIQRSA
jgi:hypothetical protein